MTEVICRLRDEPEVVRLEPRTEKRRPMTRTSWQLNGPIMVGQLMMPAQLGDSLREVSRP
jgi:hypothetical protein